MFKVSPRFLRRQYQSLIFRVLIYFAIALLVVAIVLGWDFASRIKPHFQDEILPNLSQYIQYLVEDIDLPPDINRARELSERLPFELRIEGNGVDWVSSPILGSIASYDMRPAPFPYQQYSIGRLRGSHLLLVESGGYRYLFVIDNSFRSGSRHRHWILFALLSATLLILYIAIRKLFSPVQDISTHLKRIGSGELDREISVKGNNELALLARGINDMMLKIRSMLESKAAMLLAISHELRSPITRMRLNIELLEDSQKKEKLIEDNKEIEYLVSTILETERLNSGHAELNISKFDLADLVTQVIAQYFESYEIKLSLVPAPVAMDKVKLELFIKNLVDNACRYSVDADRPVEITLEVVQQSICFSVKDYGPGVNADDLARLTDPFYRTDSARQRKTGGYGLGLYLCRLITEAHDGSFKLNSSPGQGMTVVVMFPTSYMRL